MKGKIYTVMCRESGKVFLALSCYTETASYIRLFRMCTKGSITLSISPLLHTYLLSLSLFPKKNRMVATICRLLGPALQKYSTRTIMFVCAPDPPLYLPNSSTLSLSSSSHTPPPLLQKPQWYIECSLLSQNHA
jgi:hypothetical protein